jgi:hypothetical protein
MRFVFLTRSVGKKKAADRRQQVGHFRCGVIPEMMVQDRFRGQELPSPDRCTALETRLFHPDNRLVFLSNCFA